MVGMFVGDENGIETIKVPLYGGQPRQRFPFTETCIYKNAGAFGLEQRQIARTAGSQDRYT